MSDLAEAISLLGNGRISDEPFITDRSPLSDILLLKRFPDPTSAKTVVAPQVRELPAANPAA